MKLTALFTLSLSLVLWSCDNLSDPSDALVGPRVGAEKSLSLPSDMWAIAKGQPIERAGYASKVIGTEGGALYVDAHYLRVPSGTVDGPTLFEMQVMSDGTIGATMSATSLDASGKPSADKNNVGRKGFKKVAYLAFYYGYNSKAAGTDLVTLLWLRPDGSKEPQPTTVYPTYDVGVGLVTHFSDYAIGFPN